jgi:D-alanyl-D-alanine carboxypeptidase
MRRPAVSTATLALLAWSLCATAGADDIDDIIRAEMARQKLPGLALAIVRDGTVVKLQGYGVADVRRSMPVTPDTVFKIGSVSKPLIATAVMLLVQDGRLSLDDPVSKYLEGTPDSWTGITIRHFLTHTSGVVREAPAFDPFKVQPVADVIRSAYPLPLRFPTGTKWEYCNVGYFSLAEIIGRVSGGPWAEFMAARIFRPLGMTSTSLTDVAHPLRAVGYADQDNGDPAPDWPAVRPSGAFLSTIQDLLKWDAALTRGPLLTEASREAMWTPIRLTDGATHPYGFGWELGSRGGRRYVGHGGSLPGFRSAYARFPDDRLSIILLVNAGDVDRDGIIKAIADAVTGAAVPAPAR